jgi:hypothetical protein
MFLGVWSCPNGEVIVSANLLGLLCSEGLGKGFIAVGNG